MKLQAVREETVYATDGRQVYRETGDGFDSVGSIPLASTGLSGLAERVQTTTPWKRVLETVVGSYQTVNLWPLAPPVFLATTGRRVLVSRDACATWRHCLTLPSSSVPMGVLPTGVCRHDGVTYLGEYPLAEDTTPRVHRSTDDGRTWDVAFELPGVRHVHSVTVDPYGDDVWLTTGDRDEACQLLRLRDGDRQVVGGGTQDWRIVEPAFTREAVLWGVDCGYADRNRIFNLPRAAIDAAPVFPDGAGEGDVGGRDRPTPTPEPVGTVDSSVYYAETLTAAGTEWVVLSTAAEYGGDRTASGVASSRDHTASVVAAPAETGFTDWTTLARYRRRSPLADLTGNPPRIPSANAYVLMDSSPGRGLFLNPYNTARHDGTIRRIPAAAFPVVR